MSATVEITRKGFLIAGKCVEMYEVLDSIVPWKSIEETIKVLDIYSAHYTIETAKIVGEIKRVTLNAADSYFMARQSIYEMCNLASTLIAAYKFLFDKHDASNFPGQKQLLLKVLDDGMAKMSMAHVRLEECLSNFNLAAKELTTLMAQLPIDFVKNFFESLKVQIEKANMDIKNARNKLDADIELLGLQNNTTEQTSASLEMNQLHDDIIDSVNDFVKRCEDFKVSHKNKV